MSWLDKFFGIGGGIAIQLNGTPLPSQPNLNFTTGFTVTDNPSNHSTDVAGTGGGGGSPTGAAGGDLTGTYPNPTVKGISAGSQDVKTTGIVRAGSTTAHSEQTGSVVATSAGTATTRGFVGWQYSANTSSSSLYLAKARGTEGSPATILNGDNVAQFVVAGYDGSAFISSAIITAAADSAVSSGVVPIGWFFYTGTTSSPTLRLSISSAGAFNFQANKLGNIGAGVASTDAVNVSQISADYSGTVTTTSATTTTLQSIPLSDNTGYRIDVFIEAVDTSGNKAEWISYTTWYRVSGGAATQTGTDKGPAPVSAISTGTITGAWVTVTGSSNNVVVSVVTASTSHCRFDYQIIVVPFAQPVAV